MGNLAVEFDPDSIVSPHVKSHLSNRYEENGLLIPLVDVNPQLGVEKTVQDLSLPLSSWSQSSFKRFFDCACVILASPLVVPLLLIVAILVRLTSAGPVLFVQQRVGRAGKNFPILKFRTMPVKKEGLRSSVTTAENQKFTPIGMFLRRWKLDELPQVLNVLWGQMSLVGPRPKLPEHSCTAPLACRPGITGAATVAFAREEMFLAQVPQQILDAYYQTIVLPAKVSIDAEYMREASFFSDLKLIVASVFRRWNNRIWQRLSYDELKLRQQLIAKKARAVPNYTYTPLEPSRPLQ